MKVMVTGANGFTGYYTVLNLLENGHTVIATGRGSIRLPFVHPKFSYSQMDFRDLKNTRSVILREKPDYMVHGGALSKPDYCEQYKEEAELVNVTGTNNILEACEEVGTRVIFLSTDFVFDGMKGMYEEDDERGPVNYYGQTKCRAEDLVMKSGSDWSILRTILVYGRPHLSRQNLLTDVASRLRAGERLSIFDDQVRTPTYVEDLAKAIELTVNKNSNGIFHISGSDVRTPYQMAREVAAHLGLDDSLITPVQEANFIQPARRPLITGFSIEKARAELGYQPVSFTTGLALTFK